jgi:hypothetical protein
MSARSVTFAAGLAGGLGWLVKVALIWGNDGTNTDEGLVAVFYFLGLASLVVAAAAAGVWLTVNRPVVMRVLAGILGVVVMFVLFSVFDAVLSPLASDGHWFQQEVEIVAAALGGIVLAWAARPVATNDGTALSRPPAMRD